LQGHLHSTALVTALGFVLTSLISAASWRFFESPILNH
jgi:peptidoglycan/LPS O-acetylase OafA/YrhL